MTFFLLHCCRTNAMPAGRENYVKFPLPPDFKTSLSKAYKLVTKSFVYYTYTWCIQNQIEKSK